MKRFYDSVSEQVETTGYVQVVGRRTVTATMRHGVKVDPYEYVDEDRVDVTLPRPDRRDEQVEPATVNWTAMGSQDVEHALAYADLIVRAAGLAAKANRKAGL